jgi:hypothetical protein
MVLEPEADAEVAGGSPELVLEPDPRSGPVVESSTPLSSPSAQALSSDANAMNASLEAVRSITEGYGARRGGGSAPEERKSRSAECPTPYRGARRFGMNSNTGRAIMLVLGVAATGSVQPDADAADHLDAPLTREDAAVDIADFYAWQDGDKLVAAISWAGLQGPGSEGTFGDDVLFGIHVDSDGDAIEDKSTWVRFGLNDAGEWGVKFEGIPGGDAEVVGPVDTVLEAGLGLRAFAGVREDPFFFDLDGFQATLSTATLAFDGERDTFLGTNTTMIVVEMSVDGAAAGSDQLQMWATSARRIK